MNNIKIPDNNSGGRPNKDASLDNEKLDKAWGLCIAQMQTKLDTLGADIQTKMVQLQDFMGQYNSYIQGANAAVAQSNQVLTSLAKGQ